MYAMIARFLVSRMSEVLESLISDHRFFQRFFIIAHDCMMGKHQLGWRKEDAEQKLYLPMFRLGYHLKIHVAAYGDIGKVWDDFVSQLYQQDGFIGCGESVQSIKISGLTESRYIRRSLGMKMVANQIFST